MQQLERALDAGDEAAARRSLEVLRVRAPGSWERSWAEVLWGETRDDADATEAALDNHARRWPEDAEARHRLGGLLFARDRLDAAVAHWLAVRALDAEADERAGRVDAELEDFVARTARQALEALPEPFLSELGPVPVILEERPSEALVRGGFDPRALGLFEGPDRAALHGLETPPQITRIVLFVANLCAEFPTDDELAHEVEVTVRHEVGHYFGLDEDDMTRLGLD